MHTLNTRSSTHAQALTRAYKHTLTHTNTHSHTHALRLLALRFFIAATESLEIYFRR